MLHVGAALGLATLVPLALRHASDRIEAGTPADVATTDGYVLSFQISAVLFAIGGVLAALLLERVTAQMRDPIAELEPETRWGPPPRRSLGGGRS